MRNLNDFVKGSKYFKYSEFIKSDTATRRGISNIPNSEEIWVSIENLVKYVLDPIREAFGPIRITSGYRSVELCKAIGSTLTSNHTRGEAADIEPINPNIKLIDVLNFIHENLEYRELIAEYFPDGWVHVAWSTRGNIRDLKLKDKSHNYSKVSIDYINNIYRRG